MLHVFTGTDREKARGEMMSEASRLAKKREAEMTRISDANAPEELRAALEGLGMFGGARVIILDGVLSNDDLKRILFEALPRLERTEDEVFLYEEKPLADVRRKLEKYAESNVRYDARGKEKDTSVFALASSLEKADRKTLWVGYQRALARGERAEAIHGILFWGAKRMLLNTPPSSAAHRRGAALVAELAELPHRARRRSFELEYALEHFILGFAH